MLQLLSISVITVKEQCVEGEYAHTKDPKNWAQIPALPTIAFSLKQVLTSSTGTKTVKKKKKKGKGSSLKQ